MSLTSGQLGVLPGIPLVVLKGGGVFLSWTTRAWERIATVECPEPLKEFEMTVIKPLSGQQKVLFPLDVFRRQVGNAFL